MKVHQARMESQLREKIGPKIYDKVYNNNQNLDTEHETKLYP